MERESWDVYFLRHAFLLSSRSTCIRRSVGAIAVKDKKILSSGFNGCPAGLKHCSDVGCEREKQHVPSGQRAELCRGVHAEQNLIIQAAMFGVSIKESIIYTTTFPCSVCAKMLINSRISKIVYAQGYPDELGRSLLAEAGIPMIATNVVF